MDFALSAWIVPIDVIGKFSFGVTYINLWFLRKKHCKHSLLIKCALPKQIQQIYNIYNICKRWELSGTNLTSIHMFQMGKRMTWPHVSLLSFYSLKSFYEQFFSKHSFGCFLTKMLMMMRDCIFTAGWGIVVIHPWLEFVQRRSQRCRVTRNVAREEGIYLRSTKKVPSSTTQRKVFSLLEVPPSAATEGTHFRSTTKYNTTKWGKIVET